MSQINDTQNQYADAGNLNTRLRLHQLFSTNPLGWENWVFEQYQLRPGQRILELGCGGGTVWAARGGEVPAGICLVLSDASAGMLDSAKENTRALDFVEYQVIDAQEIPYEDSSFDAVIANHMLYHVPRLDRALGEIARVLRPGGLLYATTLGRDNMPELTALLRQFDPAVDFAQDALTEAFGLESGAAKLRGFFAAITERRYPDSLRITEAEPLADYVLSTQSIPDEKAALFRRYVGEIIAENGCIDITKKAGMLVAEKAR